MAVQLIREEVSADAVKRNIEYLEEVLHWAKKSCEVIPCKAALSMDTRRKKEFDKMFGISFINTALIAITVSRNRTQVIQKLRYAISRRFVIWPPVEREIQSLITIWENMHII